MSGVTAERPIQGLEQFVSAQPEDKSGVVLPPPEDPFWNEISSRNGGQRVVSEYIWGLRQESEVEAMAYVVGLIRFVMEVSTPQAFGYACSNVIKPTNEKGLEELARSLHRVEGNQLLDVRAVPKRHFGIAMLMAVHIAGKYVDHLAVKLGDASDTALQNYFQDSINVRIQPVS